MNNNALFHGSRRQNRRSQGFTLLEILIALFIFTILSVILVAALRSVINSQSRTEAKAERLRNLQVALLIFSRDVAQSVDRPILNASGKEEGAFVGNPRGFSFTHAGFANPTGVPARSALQRTGYVFRDEGLFRLTWPVLDQAPETRTGVRRLLSGVQGARFQYLDAEGKFQDNWPLDGGDALQPLPRGVRIYLNLADWGEMTQFYMIPAQGNQNPQPAGKPAGASSTDSRPSGGKQEGRDS
ncbi:Type II secretion system protein J [Aquicella siphonis]|uniref:Type II secretion system protein J n=1 Tax=Aquicella siphonis TaxID=254247 RepID=A0A5E4PE30_9COXI|nr:type II secretion system minor pseudopilin GspJ [Aquicella siphonis]VVC75074.1 Type II secretion system protein J [Aquicella siphonis]